MMDPSTSFHDGRQAFMPVMVMGKFLNERLLMGVQMNVNEETRQL